MATPNWRLQAALDESGMSNKGLAHRVVQISTQEGHAVPCNHTYVRRWCAGMVPRDTYTSALVARIISAKLGRTLTAADLGMTAQDLDLPAPRGSRVPGGWRVRGGRGHLTLLAAPPEELTA